MPDPGTVFADKKQETIERRLRTIYKAAEKEIKDKLDNHSKALYAKDAIKRQQLADGKITSEQYKSWLRGQMFTEQVWNDQLNSIAYTLQHSNEQANAIIEGERLAVFGENATYQAYALEHDAGANLSFTVYDSATVTRLLRDKPELMPRKVVDGKKDRAWNRTVMASVITRGVISGASIQKIAANLAKETSSTNEKAMLRYARTAMTAAQNAGRIEVLQEAQGMGIQVQKVWLSTLDERTRPAHQMLDGQVAEVNEPFSSILGPIDYPGDPAADDANVWNCRCTLIYNYKEYPSFASRRDNITGEEIADMTYEEWSQARQQGALPDYSSAKSNYIEKQKAVSLADADKVFKGIWKNDVTYADYYSKLASGSIDAKKSYYADAIDRAEMLGDSQKADELRALLKLLEEFEKNGAQNSILLQERDAAKQTFEAVKNQVIPAPQQTGAFPPEAYSQARKDAALWDTPKAVDAALRDRTGEVWRSASEAEKDAIYEYTQSYHKFNEPLRGIEYGTNEYKGVGNTDLNARYANNGQMLNDMTDILNKCKYDLDVWLQRGCGFDGMDKFFQIDMNLLQNGTQDDLEKALLGKTVTEFGFCSCGSSKGHGFSGNPIMMNIYCPDGTKMMYVEPFSRYGYANRSTGGRSWDGRSKQSGFGQELETILQQGTEFRITKVEKTRGTLFVDMEVVDQSKQQRYVP